MHPAASQEMGGSGEPCALLARVTRTIRMCSLDARGQWHHGSPPCGAARRRAEEVLIRRLDKLLVDSYDGAWLWPPIVGQGCFFEDS